jgi:hypothetical protein
MKRREFITLLGGAAVWPRAARAQQTERVRRIGVLMTLAADDLEGQARVAAFRQGLQQLDWTGGCHRDRLGDWDQPRSGLVGHERVIELPIPPQDVSKSIKLANRGRPAANHRVASGGQFNVLIGHDVEQGGVWRGQVGDFDRRRSESGRRLASAARD